MTENAQLVVTLSCPDRPGIVHAVTGVIGESGGNVIQSQQFGDSDTGTFFMRVEVDSPKGRTPIDEGLARAAADFGAPPRPPRARPPRRWPLRPGRKPFPSQTRTRSA